MKRTCMSDRLVFLAMAAVVLVSSAAAQNFTVHMKADDGSAGTTYYVSPTAVRTVMPGVSDSIDRFDRGTIIQLDHKAKTYTEMTVAQVRQGIADTFGAKDAETQAIMQKMGMNAPPQVTKLGGGETIAGYPTQRYSLKTPFGVAQLWITNSLQFPPAYYKDFNLLAGQAGMFGGLGKIYETNSDMHGVILKRTMTATAAGGVKSSESAVSVEKSTVPASMFEPPAGYRKVSGR